MLTHGLTPAQLDAYLARSRASQGLAMFVEDETITRKVVALVLEANRARDARRVELVDLAANAA